MQCAICYVSDINFMRPTLVSALAMRSWVTSDIFIFTISVDEEVIRRLQNICDANGIRIIPLDPARLSGFDPAKFAKTHVPPSALGRLFLADYLPDGYDRILYVDGDTWIVGDPTPLLQYQPPPGYIASVEDVAYFHQSIWGSMGDAIRAYLTNLGIRRPASYFNSGVLLATVPAWRDITQDAFAFFLNNTGKCLYHDQSALNAVTQGRRIRLSSKWNFTTPYRHWGVEAAIRPCIYHFTGAAKPWMGKCEPWTGIHEKYMESWRRLEPLGLPTRRFDKDKMEKMDRAARSHSMKLRILFLRLWKYRASMKYLERTTEI